MSSPPELRPYTIPAEASLDTVLETIASCMPDEILSGKGLDLLLKRAQHLPACALDEMFMFESRLEDPQPACDFFLWAIPRTRFGQHLIERGKRESATLFDAGLSWYLSEVGRPDSFLARWLSMSILEYDLIGSSTDCPAPPGVFLEAHGRQQDAHPLVHGTRRREKQGNPGVLTAAVCAAVGRQEDIEERRTVESLFNAMPAGAGCSHVGALPSRKPRALRLVFSMSFDDCSDFLRNICWKGSIDRLLRIASEIGPMVRRVGLSCDATAAGVSPRMGFELFRDQAWAGTTAQDWYPFLDYVLCNHLAHPGKVKALMRWPKQQLIFWGNDVVHLVSGINHFKLILDEETVQVKSYVGARFMRNPV